MPVAPIRGLYGLTFTSETAPAALPPDEPAPLGEGDRLDLLTGGPSSVLTNVWVYNHAKYPVPKDPELLAFFKKDWVLATAYKEWVSLFERHANSMPGMLAGTALRGIYVDLTYSQDAEALIRTYPELPPAYLEAKAAKVKMDPVWEAYRKADDAWLARGGFKPPPLSDKARKLPQSPGFKLLFPNFGVLSTPAQESALRTIQRYADAFPDFFTVLNRVKDPTHGAGYQLYFVPETPASDGPLAFLQNQGKLGKDGPHAGIVYSHNQAYFIIKMASPIVHAVHAPQIGGVKVQHAEKLVHDSYNDVLAHELAHLLYDHFLSRGDQSKISDLYDLAVERHGPFTKKPYWTTNQREYFAESVMAYLTDFDRPIPPSLDGKGELYTRQQLELHHPEMARFVAGVFSGHYQRPFRPDGGMVSLRVSQLGGQTVAGGGISAQKDLVKGDHARLSVVGTGEVMGNSQSLVLRGSTGLRTTLGPESKDGLPVGVYVEGGVSGSLGHVGDKSLSNVGVYGAVGTTLKGLNVEARRDWTTQGPANTVSLGYAVQF